MHLFMILVVLGLALGLRRANPTVAASWNQQWQKALVQFLLPPALLLTTAIAILWMGPQGWMVGCWEGWISHGLAVMFLAWAGLTGLHLVWQSCQTLGQLRCHPTICLNHQPVRLLGIPELYIAQVGFWQPELVISQGMLDQLDSVQLNAVLSHEQAHADYHDTFWFFWLGWVRRCTRWLPGTEATWQELLLLREVRADYQAVQQVDPLVLAETLLLVVQSFSQSDAKPIAAAFNDSLTQNYLVRRIDAILSTESNYIESNPQVLWHWLIPISLPLWIVPWHLWGSY